MRVVVPAYMLSELKAGFAIGAVLFLPFLLIDMVTASITTSIGMFQLPPVVVSTPLKILAVCDGGWLESAGQLAVEELLSWKGATMTPDMVAELLRQLMKEALILAAPLAGGDDSDQLCAEPVSDVDQLAGAVADQRAAAGGDRDDSAGGDALVSGADGGLYAAAVFRFSSLCGVEEQLSAFSCQW